MFQVNIEADYKIGIYDRNVRRSSWRDDNEFISAEEPAPRTVAIPRIIEMLDHLYLEVRNDILGHLSEAERNRVPEVSYSRTDGSGEEPCQ